MPKPGLAWVCPALNSSPIHHSLRQLSQFLTGCKSDDGQLVVDGEGAAGPNSIRALWASLGRRGGCAQTEHVGGWPKKVGRGQAKPRKQTGADSHCEQLRRKMGLKVGADPRFCIRPTQMPVRGLYAAHLAWKGNEGVGEERIATDAFEHACNICRLL